MPVFLAAEFLDPLRLRDLHLGLPPDLWRRAVPVRGRGPGGLLAQAFVNLRATRQAVIPAAGISATASDLARFYLMLLRGGELGGTRVDAVIPACSSRA